MIDALLAAARSDAERAAALTAKATAALMAADYSVGIAAAMQAGELARGLDSPWPGFDAARLHAVGLAQAGRAVEALAVIEAYRPLVERDANREQRGRFWADYAYVLNTARRLRDTAFALQQAIDNAQALGDIAELATLTSNLATVKGNLGQVPEALALALRSLALQAQLGATGGPEGAVVETYAALYCGMVGRYEEALQRLDAAIACFVRDQQPMWIAVASNHKAQLLIDLGQFARARQTLDYERPPIDHVRARRATIAARIERALGRTGRSLLDTATAELGPGADPHVRMHVLLDNAGSDDPAACDAALRRGPADGARARIRRRRDEGAHPARARAKPRRRHRRGGGGDARSRGAVRAGAAGRPVLRAGVVARRAGVRGERRRRPGADGARARRALGAPHRAAERSRAVSRQLPAAQPDQPRPARRRRSAARRSNAAVTRSRLPSRANASEGRSRRAEGGAPCADRSSDAGLASNVVSPSPSPAPLPPRPTPRSSTGSADRASGTSRRTGAPNPLLPGAADDVVIDVAGAQTVTHRSGTNTINSLSILGDDMLAVTGGSLTVANSFSAAAATSVSGGTLTLNGVSSMASLAQSGGTLGGTGTLTVAGASSWLAGTQTGTGTTRYDGALSLTGAGNKLLSGGRTVELNGTTTWGGNTAANNNALQFAGATLNNDGTFNDQNAFASFIDHVSGTNAFNNIGTYNKQANTVTSVEAVYNNTGTTNVNAGTMLFQGTSTTSSTGVFNIAAGATLEFRNGSHTLDHPTIQGAGTFAVTTDNVGADAVVTLNGGTLTSPFLFSGSTITGTDRTFQGPATWTGGAFSGTAVDDLRQRR